MSADAPNSRIAALNAWVADIESAAARVSDSSAASVRAPLALSAAAPASLVLLVVALTEDGASLAVAASLADDETE